MSLWSAGIEYITSRALWAVDMTKTDKVEHTRSLIRQDGLVLKERILKAGVGQVICQVRHEDNRSSQACAQFTASVRNPVGHLRMKFVRW
ncbi:hypothetical protein D3C76_1298360 [compost metagenome]